MIRHEDIDDGSIFSKPHKVIVKVDLYISLHHPASFTVYFLYLILIIQINDTCRCAAAVRGVVLAISYFTRVVF
jgi:hypothetical protein